jgi:hypothetical protein
VRGKLDQPDRKPSGLRALPHLTAG